MIISITVLNYQMWTLEEMLSNDCPICSPLHWHWEPSIFPTKFVSDITTLKAATFPQLWKIILLGNQITNFVGMTTLLKLERLNLDHNRLSQVAELYRIVSSFSLPTSIIFISNKPWNFTDIYAWVYRSLYVHGKLVQWYCDWVEIQLRLVSQDHVKYTVVWQRYDSR